MLTEYSIRMNCSFRLLAAACCWFNLSFAIRLFDSSAQHQLRHEVNTYRLHKQRHRLMKLLNALLTVQQHHVPSYHPYHFQNSGRGRTQYFEWIHKYDPNHNSVGQERCVPNHILLCISAQCTFTLRNMQKCNVLVADSKRWTLCTSENSILVMQQKWHNSISMLANIRIHQ